MWTRAASFARNAASGSRIAGVAGTSARYAVAVSTGLLTLAAASTLAGDVSCQAEVEAAYAYSAPTRKSEERAKAAVEAAKPRVKVPHQPKPRVLFVLGGPGAGKGTQCSLLVKEYGFVHLSAGDLLREERDSGSADGEMIENFIREGKIVPVEVTVALIKKAMARSGASKFLVDGFPRNFNNLEGWNKVMGDEAEVDGVLQYDVPESIMVDRLLERGKTSGRSDDNAETIVKRLRTYAESTVAVLDHFRAQGKVHVINGDRPVKQVFADTKSAVAATVAAEVLAHNALLLESIGAGDWAAYEALTSASLTGLEPECPDGGLIRGLPFHKRVFEEGAKARAQRVLAGGKPGWSVSTMSNPEVRLLGPKHALVTYTRLTSPLEGGGPISRVLESRVWGLEDGKAWKLLHFHRSPMPAVEAPAH